MQSTYVLARDLHITHAEFYGKVGDVFVHTPPSKVVAYRNGGIVGSFELSNVSIEGLLRSLLLVKHDSPAATPTVEVEPIQEPVAVVGDAEVPLEVTPTVEVEPTEETINEDEAVEGVPSIEGEVPGDATPKRKGGKRSKGDA